MLRRCGPRTSGELLIANFDSGAALDDMNGVIVLSVTTGASLYTKVSISSMTEEKLYVHRVSSLMTYSEQLNGSGFGLTGKENMGQSKVQSTTV